MNKRNNYISFENFQNIEHFGKIGQSAAKATVKATGTKLKVAGKATTGLKRASSLADLSKIGTKGTGSLADLSKIGTKGTGSLADLSKIAGKADDITDAAKIAGKADDAADAAKITGKADDATDAAKIAGKADDAADAAKITGKADDAADATKSIQNKFSSALTKAKKGVNEVSLKMADFVKKNPKKFALLTASGISAGVIAIKANEQTEKINNTGYQIIKISQDPNDKNQIEIMYTPNDKFTKKDIITIINSNSTPSIDNTYTDIVDTKEGVFTIKGNITSDGNNGTFNVKTKAEDQFVEIANDTISIIPKTAAGIGAGIIETGAEATGKIIAAGVKGAGTLTTSIFPGLEYWWVYLIIIIVVLIISSIIAISLK